MAKIKLYCIKNNSGLLQGYFDNYEKFKEYYYWVKRDYTKIKFTPVEIIIDTDYDWKNNLLPSGNVPSIFPETNVLIELLN